jgi:hypothetical protein
MTEDYVLICKACHDAERGWWIPEYEENSATSVPSLTSSASLLEPCPSNP